MKRCNICPHECNIDNSICGQKPLYDKEDEIISTAVAIDPVEKKPLYHFMPASKTLSIGTLGCNLKCLNCQNHEIAQPSSNSPVRTEVLTAEGIVQLAQKHGLKSISWTYNECSIHPKWIMKTSQLAQKHGIKTILVTNGYTSRTTLDNLAEYVDAVNVDLKSMDDDFYLKVCSGKLEPVLDSIRYYHENNIHTEVTNLLIPGYNDEDEDIFKVVEFIHSLSENIPLHFSAFYPQYKLSNLPATKDEIVLNACKIALNSGLKYVYAGNIYSSDFDNTYCSNCKKEVIKRDYYNTTDYTVNGYCPECNKKIY